MFLTVLEAEMYKSKVQSETFPGLQMVTFSLCSPTAENADASSHKDTDVLIKHHRGPKSQDFVSFRGQICEWPSVVFVPLAR